MREGKQFSAKRGEHINMRGRHVSSPDRQHRQPARNLRYRQMRSSAPKPEDEKVYRYYVLWKPYGVATKNEDMKNAKPLETCVPVEGVFPIGYLDATSEGLLLLTDNPRFRFGLNHSKCQESRIFLAQVELGDDEAMVSDEALDALAEGVVLSDGKTLPMEAEVIEDPTLPVRSLPVKEDKNTCWLAITCQEGWSRHIRRITAALGYPTLRLVQWAFGPVSLYEMTEGQLRELQHQELRWVRSVLDRTPAPLTQAERQHFQASQRRMNARQKSQRFAARPSERSFREERSLRSERGDRPERPERGERPERPVRGEHSTHGERPARPVHGERREGGNRAEHAPHSSGHRSTRRPGGHNHSGSSSRPGQPKSHSPKGHGSPRGPQRENRGGKGKGLRSRG